MTIILRDRLRPGDGAAAQTIAAATGNFTDEELSWVPEILDELLAKGEAGSGYRFLATDNANGEMTGFAIYGPSADENGAADLYWIAVSPDAAGAGLGLALLRAAIQRSAAEGLTRMLIETEAGPAYAPARRLYERCGFRLLRIDPEYYGEGRDRAIYAGPIP